MTNQLRADMALIHLDQMDREQTYQRLAGLIQEYLRTKQPLDADAIVEAEKAYKMARLMAVYGGHAHSIGGTNHAA